MSELDTPKLRAPLQNSASPRDQEPVGLEKLMKWQDERVARRLRGEYESAVMHLSEVINDNMKTAVNISAVRVEGAPHTRKSFLAGIIEPALPSRSTDGAPPPPTTLEDVLHTTRRIAHGLQKTDIFASVSASLERPESALADPTVGDVDLVFKTKERGRWFVTSSTEVGNSEGTASASARIRNVFGGAETFEANMSLGTKTRRAFRATLVAPLTPQMIAFGEIGAYGLEKDLTSYASCTEGLRGVRAVIRTGTPSRGAHELAYDAVVRHVAGLTPTASISMREAAGTSTKSALSHTFLFDTRDDKIAATRGVYAKLFTELAGGFSGVGLGGDARHLKVEGEGQVSRAVGLGGVSMSLAARGGLLWGLGEGGKTLFSDRFQLGGPTSVRSFRVNGLGPRDGDDSVGGELYYSAGVSVVSNIPTKSHWPVKTHAWLNAGRLDSVDQARPLKDTITEALGRPSISAGVGLIYRFDPIRVEVNFGVPLAASGSDGTRRGIQVGMGLEFL
ncbi:surface antigen-domain-containing protein [Pholiota molesta]|nr:surface antigen-domain-containing protein [Pholiota molesta]